RLQRQYADPTQAALALLPDIGQPAIVALADRDLRLWAVGHPLQEEGGPEHLDIHPKLIHVLEADRPRSRPPGPLAARPSCGPAFPRAGGRLGRSRPDGPGPEFCRRCTSMLVHAPPWA